MKKHEVVVIFTCFNRKEQTLSCMHSLVEKNPNVYFRFVVVDDNSTDGTEKAIKALNYDTYYLKGTGSLYWAGGMRKGINYFIEATCFNESDYVMLVNDDVSFFDGSIDKMIVRAQNYPLSAIVGNCCDRSGRLSYGAIKFYKNKLRKIYYHLDINNAHINADTFNCNCVLFPTQIMRKLGNFDKHYTHSFADYDYGVTVKRNGFNIFGTDFYVGVCNENSLEGTWQDPNLSIGVRLKKKAQPKGLPFKEHFYFLRKNIGLVWAFRYAFTPYIKILLSK